MAIEIAEAVVGALNGELSATAVNAPMVAPEVKKQPHCDISMLFSNKDHSQPPRKLNYALDEILLLSIVIFNSKLN